MSTVKRMTSLFVIAALAFCFLAVIWTAQQEDANAAISKKVIRKAKKYTGKKSKLFKVGSCWYCFRSRKVKTGLQKVGVNYYYFNKSTGKMYLKTGLKKVGTYYYYFKKSSGKAPAFRNKSRKDTDNRVWFFRSNGRRYKYSYNHTGSTAGNTAAGIIISEAKIKADNTGTDEQLLAAYKKIVKRSSYLITGEPDLDSAAWIGTTAKNCAVNKGGKCYGFAALTYVTFKALGKPDIRLVTGTLDRPKKDGSIATGAHAWVENTYNSMGLYLYDSNQDNVNGKGTDFFKNTIIYADPENMTRFARDVAGNNHIYYPEKYFK